MSGGRRGVLLMSFGSASGAADVGAYLERVRGGRPAPDELVAEFRRRYELVGGSPLLKITARQAQALESVLNENGKGEAEYRAAVGMRYSAPWIEDGLRSLAEWGADRIVCVIMSPQYSPFFMGGYLRAVEAAKPRLPGSAVSVAGAWYDEPAFTGVMAANLRKSLAGLSPHRVRVIMTVHSLPRPMVEKEPDYLKQLAGTARLIAAQAGLGPDEWEQAYQSAGHTPEEWLKPDFKDRLPELKAQGYEAVLVVPVQFLADHLETLYDVDIAGGAEAAESGLRFARSPAPNVELEFIRALANVTLREFSKAAPGR
jgi:ferrochelatase